MCVIIYINKLFRRRNGKHFDARNVAIIAHHNTCRISDEKFMLHIRRKLNRGTYAE